MRMRKRFGDGLSFHAAVDPSSQLRAFSLDVHVHGHLPKRMEPHAERNQCYIR
ncbi:hypothetical protein HanIR_Chr04g0207591 [Helianthus annuus]|nr:hypothetical protein HanIR_Chr04g0207591 [Helianthus annuus]